MKNAAYAWRQLVFYLSLSSPDAVEAFFTAAELQLAEEALGAQFRPALLGLRSAACGEPVDAGGGRRFLGWSVGPHWLLSA